MTTATITIPDQKILDILKLSKKFNNSTTKFPLELSDLTTQQLSAVATAYANILVTKDASTVLGKQLSALADTQVATIVDAINTPGATTTTYNANVSFVKTTGALLAGTGNPNGKFAVVSDGKIELGLAARIAGSLDLPVPTNGTYNVALPTGKDWSIVFSAGLLAGTTNAITALYDVTLTMFGNNAGLETGAKAVFKLDYTGEGYNWISATAGTITDSATNSEKSATQNIERYSFFTDLHQAGVVPVGTFKVRLSATHRKTGAVLTNDITVIAAPAVVTPPVTPSV